MNKLFKQEEIENKLVLKTVLESSYEELSELAKSIADNLKRGQGKTALKAFIYLADENTERMKRLEDDYLL